MMQQEMENETMGMPIHIFCVNAPGTEGAIPEMVDGRMLPLLQDTVAEDVADLWHAHHFDLVVLDGDNAVVRVINLAQDDLMDSDNYAAMKQMLLEMSDNGGMMHGGGGAGMGSGMGPGMR